MVMHPKDAEGIIANSADPDQTAPLVWSGSALFAQTCLSENLGVLQYRHNPYSWNYHKIPPKLDTLLAPSLNTSKWIS